jgi:hypothetical protein
MTLTVVAVIFGIFAIGLIVLLIYKSTLTMHEDDQLFLDDSEVHMQREQEENTRKMQKLTPYVRLFGAASAVLIVAIAALWIYTGLSAVQ